MKIYSKFYLLIYLLILLSSCATTYESTNMQKYMEYLSNTDINTVAIYYDDVINRIGQPITFNEHENDFVGIWQESYDVKARIASNVAVRKIILYFDKKTKRLIDKQLKY